MLWGLFATLVPTEEDMGYDLLVQIVNTIVHPEGKCKVDVFRRADGSFECARVQVFVGIQEP